MDVLVTDAGVAVNPARSDLAARLREAGLPRVGIGSLKERAEAQATAAATPDLAGDGKRVVAASQYRDGTVTDLVRAVEP